MDVKTIFLIGLAIVFVPIVILGLSTIDAEWTNVGIHLTWPVLIIFLMALTIPLVRGRTR